MYSIIMADLVEKTRLYTLGMQKNGHFEHTPFSKELLYETALIVSLSKYLNSYLAKPQPEDCLAYIPSQGKDADDIMDEYKSKKFETYELARLVEARKQCDFKMWLNGGKSITDQESENLLHVFMLYTLITQHPMVSQFRAP